MRLIDLEFLPFLDAMRVQERCLSRLINSGEESLILVEHPDTITLGLRSKPEDLRRPELNLLAAGIEVIRIKRGGGATCHFSGQLVAYPIMRVLGRQGGLKKFVNDLEETLIRTLAHFGLDAGRKKGSPGIWMGEGQRKIASLGLALQHGMSYHGIALNVEHDLDLFSTIVPCGESELMLTSLHRELGENSQDMEKVKEVFVRCFSQVFDVALQKSDTL